MTENIWNERPPIGYNKLVDGVLIDYYYKTEMDAWLEKLRVEYDILKIASEVYKNIEDPVVITKDKLDAIKNKAEKLDWIVKAYNYETGEELKIAGFTIKMIKAIEKLEAVRSDVLALKSRLVSLINYPTYEKLDDDDRMEPTMGLMRETAKIAENAWKILEDDQTLGED